MTTLGPEGKLLSAITGDESDAELRRLVVKLSNQCPLEKDHEDCPFRMLQGLSNVALENVVNQMDRQTLLELFKRETECRNTPDSPCQESGTPK